MLLVRYGEISLKGKNRRRFEDALIRQMKLSLGDLPYGTIRKTFGRIYVSVSPETWRQAVEAIGRVFGVVSISPVVQVPLDMDALRATALTLGRKAPAGTFKIETKRVNKQFPMRTPEINYDLGGYVVTNTDHLTVDVHNPDIVINVEIRHEGAYLFSESIPALGGLPVSTSGRGLLLLSGGIDSPVAGFLSMKRGVTLEGLHFHSYPFTSQRAQEKVEELAKLLTPYNTKVQMRLWLCQFTEIQKALQQNPYPDLKITLMRRFMLRIADALARQRGILALITGDNLGQVASQTMHSIHTINAVTNLPVLRPLVTMDKQEIIDISRRIGTYETSILPYEDCCTVFVPKNPATRPKIAAAEEAESHMDVAGLVAEALANTQSKVITANDDDDIF